MPDDFGLEIRYWTILLRGSWASQRGKKKAIRSLKGSTTLGIKQKFIFHAKNEFKFEWTTLICCKLKNSSGIKWPRLGRPRKNFKTVVLKDEHWIKCN